MKKLIVLLLLAGIGYSTYCYFGRTKGEVELHTQVKKLLERVPSDAKELDKDHVRQLEDLLHQHGFELVAGSALLSTASTKRRPLGEAGNPNDFVEHTLVYSYKRPQLVLPFKTEVHKATETQLVEVPGSAPTMSTGMAQSQMIRRSMNFQKQQSQAAAQAAARAQAQGMRPR